MQNFWEKNGWEDSDRHLSALRRASFRRRFPDLLKGPGLYVIRGPRQIGKSSWLKSILSTLAQADSRSVLYHSCENLRDHQELAALIEAHRERPILLLDEVSFVNEWWRAIKHEIDRDNKKTIVMTGSHAADLKFGADTMPGRFGAGGEYELLPMDFAEFTEMRQQAGWPMAKSWSEALEQYFKVGGFPLAVQEAGPDVVKPVQAMETYRRWLLGDLIKLGKQELFLREVMGQIALTMTSTMSLQTLAQKTQMGSHMTAQSYVELLDSSFALKTLFAMDPEKNSYQFKKQKKFYFRDPLLYWMALEWAGLRQPAGALSAVAEMVAHEALVRRYKRFGYVSNRLGEIDFVCPKEWALEVKWTEAASAFRLSNAFLRSPLPAKIVWSQENFLKDFPPG